MIIVNALESVGGGGREPKAPKLKHPLFLSCGK